MYVSQSLLPPLQKNQSNVTNFPNCSTDSGIKSRNVKNIITPAAAACRVPMRLSVLVVADEGRNLTNSSTRTPPNRVPKEAKHDKRNASKTLAVFVILLFFFYR